MKSDYFIVEIRYPDDIKHKPVKKQDIRHCILVDNPGIELRVKSVVKGKENVQDGEKPIPVRKTNSSF